MDDHRGLTFGHNTHAHSAEADVATASRTIIPSSVNPNRGCFTDK
jgi:hypothetical protein